MAVSFGFVGFSLRQQWTGMVVTHSGAVQGFSGWFLTRQQQWTLAIQWTGMVVAHSGAAQWSNMVSQQVGVNGITQLASLQ